MELRMNKPFVTEDECVFEDQGGGVVRRILAYGDDLMQVEVRFEEGAVGAMHSHLHTQLTYVMEGKFEFTIGDEKKIVKNGDTLYKVPNIMHGYKQILPDHNGILLHNREQYLDLPLKWFQQQLPWKKVL